MAKNRSDRPDRKFTNEELLDLVAQSVSVKDMATRFGCSGPAVRQRLKRLKEKEKAKEKPIPGIFPLKDINDDPKCFILKQNERLFIDFHLIRNLEIKDAMIRAGYEGLSEGQIYYKAKKILRKYEAGAEDNRDIMRTLGAGEVELISRMLHLARNGKSETARVQAISKLGQWLGLDKETVQGAQGITIIFEGSPGQTNQVAVVPQVDAQADPQAPAYPARVLQITK